MKRRYLKIVPVITMLVLCQAASFLPKDAKINSDIFGEINVSGITQVVSRAAGVSEVLAKEAWNDSGEIPEEEKKWFADQVGDGGYVGFDPNAQIVGDTYTNTTPSTPSTKPSNPNNGASTVTNPTTPTKPNSNNGKELVPQTGTQPSTQPIAQPTTKPSTPSSINANQNLKNTTDHILIVIDGKIIDSDAYPLLRDNRVLVPVRTISEGLKAKVTYTSATKAFKVVSQDTKITITGVIGKNTINVNGKEQKIDLKSDNVKAVVVNNRTYLPLRALCENLGTKVEYKDRIVYITTQA